VTGAGAAVGMDREQFWALVEAAKAATGGDCQAQAAQLVAALAERSVDDVLATWPAPSPPTPRRWAGWPEHRQALTEQGGRGNGPSPTPQATPPAIAAGRAQLRATRQNGEQGRRPVPSRWQLST
jgi:hypothetical protein